MISGHTGAVGMAGLFILTAYFGPGESEPVDELARLITWTLDAAENGFLLMVRGDEQLLIFVTDDWLRPYTRILYTHQVP